MTCPWDGVTPGNGSTLRVMIVRGVVLGALVAALSVGLVAGIGPPAERTAAQDGEATTHRIEGTAVYEDGRPLSGEQVFAVGTIEYIGQFGRGRIAADGSFSIEVEDGEYWFQLEHGARRTCVVTGYESPRPDAEAVIVVAGEDVTGIRLVVTVQPGSTDLAIKCYFPSRSIAGIVTDEDGTPISDLYIRTDLTRRVGQSQFRSEPVGGTRTVEDGTFRLFVESGPDVVRHELQVEARDFSECTVSGYQDGAVRGPASFPRGESDIEGLRVVLSGPPMTKHGPVDCHFATPLLRIEGTILGHDGEPLEGVNVRATGTFATSSRGPWAAEATGSSGAFSVEVPEGTYTLTPFIDHSDGECDLGAYRHGTVAPDRQGEERVLVEGSNVTALTMRLPQPIEELCRRVHGVVTTATGQPSTSDRWVSLYGEEDLRGYRRETDRQQDGTFTLYVAEGTYALGLGTSDGDRCTVAHPLQDGVREGQALITVGEQGVAYLRVTVSGPPTVSGLRCFNPPDSVTTQLQPGWNLAGWTDVPVGVQALFATIPELQVAHAWDAEAQAFQVAVRTEGSVSGDLVRVTPGMGLWLYLDGQQPVEWTQPVVSESARTNLAEGWNLVAWVGEEGAAPGAAFASLGANLQTAVGWDPATDELLRYEPEGASGGNTMRHLKRGEGVWVQVATGRDWLQPGSPEGPPE